MLNLTIDNKPVEVSEGSTILDAARKLGIEVPTLCFRDGCDAETSCMVCVVKVQGRGGMVPSCATLAEDGMIVTSESDEVIGVRREALELLLGDHLGDCAAPCQLACPAGINIPLMLRHVAAGRMDEALVIARGCAELSGGEGQACDGRCEKACRRGRLDAPVAIRLLQRYVVEKAGGEAAVPTEQEAAPVMPSGKARAFSTHMGRLLDGEMELLMEGVSDAPRTAASSPAELSAKQASAEAARCMHCDCRAADNCKLRDWSQALGASATRYRGERRMFEQHAHHDLVIYEPGKCISCGLCVQIARREGEQLGLTFIGRGFDVRVAVPFGRELSEGLKVAAEKCAEACPTGAIVLKDA